jgi:hypothetical protein
MNFHFSLFRRLFGRITQKVPQKKKSGREKYAAEFWPMLFRKAEKGSNF